MFKNNEVTLQNKILISALMLFIAVFFLLDRFYRAPAPTAKEAPVTADTIIPKGYVLVPLEIANIQTVASLIDQFGVIDLYAGSARQESSFQIANKIKVMRAPLNPNQYAVLVTEDMSREIMKYKGPFWAVVQNRGVASPVIEQKPILSVKKTISPRVVEVEYYQGSKL